MQLPDFSMDAWSPQAIFKDFGLGIVVDLLMLPVTVGILYAFSYVVSIRERDMLYTHLPFEARCFWLHTREEMEIELHRRKLERGDDVDAHAEIDEEKFWAAPKNKKQTEALLKQHQQEEKPSKDSKDKSEVTRKRFQN